MEVQKIMFTQYPKLFIFLSLIILALTIYQISQKSKSEPIKQENSYPLNTQKTQSYQQGKIDSH